MGTLKKTGRLSVSGGTVFFALLFLVRFPLLGQTGPFVGLSGEVNIITLNDRGFAAGGLLDAGYRFGPVFSTGVKTGVFYDLTQLLSLESRLFLRWYFVRQGIAEFFFQGDGGLLVTFREGLDLQESRGGPVGGLTLGVRIALPERWYLEPYVRGGYPVIGGGGITVGFLPKPRRSTVEDKLKNGEELVVIRSLNGIEEIADLSLDPSVYFAANSSGFSGLDRRSLENNYRLLREIALYLKQNPEYRLLVMGHANPVINTRTEEREILNPLSVKRAEQVANLLITYGVSRERLVITGSGGTKTLVPREDRSNWDLNRRVEFTLIRDPGEED